MPPKDPAEEQALKAYQKALEEKQRQEFIIYKEEFRRYQVIRDMLQAYWVHVCHFIAKADAFERRRILAESQDLHRFLQSCISRALNDEQLIERERNWAFYLGADSSEPAVVARAELLLAEVELVIDHIHPDTTPQSLRQNLSSLPSARRFVEDKATLFDVFTEMAVEISNVLAALEKLIRHCPDYGFSQMSAVGGDPSTSPAPEAEPPGSLSPGKHLSLVAASPSTIPASLTVGHAESSEDIVFPGGVDPMADMNAALPASKDLLATRPLFSPKQSLPELVAATLGSTYIRPVTVGKRAPSAAGTRGPGKAPPPAQTAAVQDKSAEKPAKGSRKKGKQPEEVEQAAPDEEVKAFILCSDNRIYNFDAITCGSMSAVPEPGTIPPSLEKGRKRSATALNSTGGFADRPRGPSPPTAGSGTTAVSMQQEANSEQDRSRVPYEHYANYIQNPTALLKAASHVQAYLTTEQLRLFSHIAALQAHRVHLRALLFDLHDMCAKYLLDHTEDYLTQNAEPIKLSAPTAPALEEESLESSNTQQDARDDSDSDPKSQGTDFLDDNDSAGPPPPHKNPGGLSASLLEAHNAVMAAQMNDSDNDPNGGKPSQPSTTEVMGTTVAPDPGVQYTNNTDIIIRNRAETFGIRVPLVLAPISKRGIKNDELYAKMTPLSGLAPTNSKYICQSVQKPLSVADSDDPQDDQETASEVTGGIEMRTVQFSGLMARGANSTGEPDELTVDTINKHFHFFGKILDYKQNTRLNHTLHIWINTAKNPRFRNVRFTPTLKLILPNSLCLSNVAVRLCATPVDLVGYFSEGLSYMSLQRYVRLHNLKMYEFKRAAKMNQGKPSLTSLTRITYPDIVAFAVETYVSKLLIPQLSPLVYIETDNVADQWMTDTSALLKEVGIDVHRAVSQFNMSTSPELIERAIQHINIKTLLGHKQKLRTLYKVVLERIQEGIRDMCLTNIAYLFRIDCVNLIVRNMCLLELLITEDERNNSLIRRLLIKLIEEETLIAESLAKKKGKGKGKGKKDTGPRASMAEALTREDIYIWEVANKLVPSREDGGSRPATPKKGKLDRSSFPNVNDTILHYRRPMDAAGDIPSDESTEPTELSSDPALPSGPEVSASEPAPEELSKEDQEKRRLLALQADGKTSDVLDESFTEPLIPELLPVGEIYILNILRTPPQLIEANNWTVQPLTHMSAADAKIAKLTDGLGGDTLTTIERSIDPHANPDGDSRFLLEYAERYQPISLEQRIIPSTNDRSYADTHLDFEDSFGEDDVPESSARSESRRWRKKQVNARDLVFAPVKVEHLPYPITAQVLPIYPGCTTLRCSVIARERSSLLAFDGATLWSWIPNVFKYTQSTLTAELVDEHGGAEETLNVDDAPEDQVQPEAQAPTSEERPAEEVEQGQALDPAAAASAAMMQSLAMPGEPQKEQLEPITIEFVLPPELHVTRILTAEEAIYMLQKAMLTHDQTDLVGVYFVAIWNIAIRTWDVDGIQSVSYKPERRTVIAKILKTGPLSIVALKYSSLPYRGWSLTPCMDRGDNLNIDECAETLSHYIAEGQTKLTGTNEVMTGGSGPEMMASIGSGRGLRSVVQGSIVNQNSPYTPVVTNQASRGRFSYYHNGATGGTVAVPKLTERAVDIYNYEGVLVHSVLLKLALPSGIILYIRILPEGYEVVGFAEIPNFANLASQIGINDYLPLPQQYMLLNIAHLTVPTTSTTTARSKMARARLAAAQLAQQSTFEALNQIRCPKSLKNIVFPDVTELFSVLTRSGIFLSHTTDHDILQANLRPKNRNIDTEMARQLAVLACVNLAGAKEPLVRVLGSSSWNRRLPNEPILPPPQNQFQLTEDKFAESLKRSRGWLSEPELREHERLEKKREKAEKKRLEQEAKKPGSTVPPPKKIEQKIEKGMPEPLGPGTYGFTKLTVDIRAEAVEALKNYMKEYLQSIFPTQAVVYDKAACFVVGCNVNNVDMSLPPLRVGSSKGGELDPTTFSVRPASTAGMTGDERAAALEAANATRDTALESLVAAGVTLADFSKSIYGLIKEPAPKPLPPEYVKACADIEAYESKHKKGKKGKKGRRVVEESGEELDQTRAESRVTQTKPYDVVTCDFHSMLQAGGLSFRTVCITEGLLDPGNFTTRACAVPFAPNPDSNEEFCPANCFGCESHSSALQLLLSKSRNLDVEAPDAVSQLLGSCRYDPVLLTMVFRLLNTLRLASLG